MNVSSLFMCQRYLVPFFKKIEALEKLKSAESHLQPRLPRSRRSGCTVVSLRQTQKEGRTQTSDAAFHSQKDDGGRKFLALTERESPF